MTNYERKNGITAFKRPQHTNYERKNDITAIKRPQHTRRPICTGDDNRKNVEDKGISNLCHTPV
jgi:hypothetical protein